MAADPETPVTPESRAYLEILGSASEDCYELREFQLNMERAYEGLGDSDARRTAIRQAFATLLERGDIRLHKGRQCTGNDHSGRDEPVGVAEIRTFTDDKWGLLCVCDTDQTMDAYNIAYRTVHGVRE